MEEDWNVREVQQMKRTKKILLYVLMGFLLVIFSLLLLLTATIWGVAFVAQSVGMDHVGPFTFNAIRSIIGGIVLIPCIFFLDHRKSAI